MNQFLKVKYKIYQPWIKNRKKMNKRRRQVDK